MSKQYAGLVELKRSANTITAANFGAATPVPGKFTADSALNPTVTQPETTTGVLHGGDSVTPDFGIYDQSAVDALRTLAEDDTEVYWAFKMADGTIYASGVAVNPIVNQVPDFNSRNGLSIARLSFVYFHTTAVFKVVV